jgi:para-nitrobenzyl esterase
MTRPISACLFALTLSWLAACSDGGDSSPPAPAEPLPELGTEVSVAGGALAGRESDRALAWEWLGIPYAEAPVGELRWKAPRAVTGWPDTLAAQDFAPPCPQFDFFGAYIGEEDCLYLNVWRPRSQERDLPVFLWIHGGSNNWGSADWPVYDGARLAEQANIVVVTIQYRLGPLGWLYYPPLQQGDANDNSGNFGTLDIIASLRWVQDNIAAFGGDPGDVTAAGESAGGADVLSLTLADQASGLFHKAIVQSAGGSVTDVDRGAAAAAALVEELMALEGATPASLSDAELADYLRGKSAEEIIRNNPGTPAIFGDGHVLPVAGFDLYDSGDFPNKVPLLIGTNKDEFKLYTNPVGYNLLPDASPELRDAVGRYVSDLWRVTGADSIATRLRDLDDYPDIYVYRFNWGSPDEVGNSPLPAPFGATGGAHHGAELPFMFGNWDRFLLSAYSDLFYNEGNAASRETMAATMVEYWGSFVRQGNPNGGSLPPWSPWSNEPGAFKAVTLDVNYADDQAKIGEDYEAWTVETVLADVQANVPEPLLSALMTWLDDWLAL